MHKLFAEWYRVAGTEPKGEDLPKRWAGVEALIAAVDTARAIDLVRLFLGSTTVSAEVKEQFALTFQKVDPAFPMRDNSLELRVLAGAAIAYYVETQRTNLGDALALAVVCGACSGIRQPVLLPEIVTIGEKYLFDEGLRVRAFSPALEIKGMTSKADQLLTDVKTTAAQNNLATTVEALGSPLQKLHAGIGAVAKSANEAVRHLGDVAASAVEQTNILWWVFAGTGRDISKPYSGIALDAAALIAGKELADLTELLPGPVAAPAVLDKVLAGAKSTSATVSLESAVTGTEEAWRRKCLETAETRLDELCPIHFALRKSVDGATWIKSFESASGIKVKRSGVTAVGIAVQIYNERLLQRAVRG